MMLTRYLLVAGFLLGMGACDRNKPEAAKPAPAPTEAKPSDADANDLHAFLRKDQTAATDASALPPGHPPIGDDQRPPQPAAGELPPGHPPIEGAEAAAPAGRLHFDPPIDWKPETVTSTMRIAQFLIPRVEGDKQDGQMIVFHFGPGQGGPTDMNIARWKGMFTTPDGQPVADSEAKIEKLTINGLPVTTLDVSGLYSDPMMMQSGGAPIEGPARLLAAIVETRAGPYFFKAVGPKDTISAQEANFTTLVNSVKPE